MVTIQVWGCFRPDPGPTAPELSLAFSQRRCVHNLNPHPNPNLQKRLEIKIRIKIKIARKGLSPVLNSMAVHPSPLPRGEGASFAALGRSGVVLRMERPMRMLLTRQPREQESFQDAP